MEKDLSTGCETPLDWKKPGMKLPVMCDDDVMKQKEHGTSKTPVIMKKSSDMG